MVRGLCLQNSSILTDYLILFWLGLYCVKHHGVPHDQTLRESKKAWQQGNDGEAHGKQRHELNKYVELMKGTR